MKRSVVIHDSRICADGWLLWFVLVLGALVLMLLLSTTAAAGQAYYSFEGRFTDGSETQKFLFHVESPLSNGEPFQLRTWHALGTPFGQMNAAGDVISGGGFDPVLGLFDGSNALITANDDFFGMDSQITWGSPAYTWQQFPVSLGTNWNPATLPADDYRLDLVAYGRNLNGRQAHWAVDIVGPQNHGWPGSHMTLTGVGYSGVTTIKSLKFGTTDFLDYSDVIIGNGQSLVMTGDLVIANTGWGRLLNSGAIVANRVEVKTPGTLNLDGGTISPGELVVNGLLQGHGDVILDAGGSLQNYSSMQPYGDASFGGAINVHVGDFVQGQYGRLFIPLGGMGPEEFGRLHVLDGGAQLDGELEVWLYNGFTPEAGSVFEFLTAADGFGGTQFDTHGGTLGGGLWYEVVYSREAVRAIISGIAGDYNLNGVVDAADYVVWRNTFGDFGRPLAADGNADGFVNAGDYDVWRAHFGQTASSGASIAATSVAEAIPEPAGLLLIALASCGVMIRKPRVRRYCLLMGILALNFGVLTAPIRATTIYDASTDFSATNNPHGAWSYGWYSSSASEFHVYPTTGGSGGLYAWTDPPITVLGAPSVFHNATENTYTSGTVSVLPGQLTFHPGNLGQYSVVRWSAPQSGLTHIAAAFTGRDSWGTTTDVRVLHNGVSLYDGAVNGFATGPPTFETMRTVLEGDTIDFAVGYGNGSFFNDTTSIDGVIDFDPGAYLPGDFNFNGAVDAADYVVWRENPGGIYTPDDYNVWRTHFGQEQCFCPTFESQPQSQTVSVGSDVTFSVEVTGTEPISYQWQKDEVPVPGAMDPSFSILNAVLADAGDYGVLSANSCGATLSDTATLTVILEPLVGDYNHNGVVDAADYVVWRNTLGHSGTGLAADGDSDEDVDGDDYGVWKAHVGQIASTPATANALDATGSASANATISEPASLALLLICSAILWIRKGRNR